jgi:hypothetical protein
MYFIKIYTDTEKIYTKTYMHYNVNNTKQPSKEYGLVF